MTLGAQCGVASVRAAAVALLCVGLGSLLARGLAGWRRRMRLAAWVFLMVPFATPALVVGYAYADFSLSLVHHPAWRGVLYVLLLCAKLTPVACVVLYVVPGALSPEAFHCHRLLSGEHSSVRARVSGAVFVIRSSALKLAAAAGITFLLAFSEFEMASLMGIGTWTVGLFDAHAGGLGLGDSLRLAALPAAVECAFVAAVLVLLTAGRRRLEASQGRPRPGGAARAFVWTYLVLASLAVTAVPGVVVLRGTVTGLRAVLGEFVLGRDIAASVLFGATAAAAAYVVAGWVSREAAGKGALRRAFLRAFPAVLPGLLGPLVLSLGVVFLFQAPLVRVLYDTPLPLALALTVVLLPFAVVLRLLLRRLRPDAALHGAELLAGSRARSVRGRARRLVWSLGTRRRFWLIFLLFCWGYFDLTASAVLAPPAMTTATVRLYNLMHYGRSAVLSAMVCMVFLVPIVLVLAAEAAQGLLCRLWSHV